MDLVVDPDFENMIPPLAKDERGMLEAQLIADGCRGALVAWDTQPGPVLVDGHNRYEICTRREIPFGVELREFESKADAKIWIAKNQIGRRNVAPVDKVPLVRWLKAALAEEAAGRRRATQNNDAGEAVRQNFSEQDEGDGRVRDQLGSQIGVSGPTYEALEEVVDKGSPELVAAVRSKEVGASTAATVASLPKEEQTELVARGKKEIIAAAKKIKEEQRIQGVSALTSSESCEWYTPAEYIEAARELMGGIDLDPASCEQANITVKAGRFFTAEDDGLSREWSGRVWLNPPYGRDDENESNQGKWSREIAARYDRGEISEAVLLVNAVTDRKWFGPLWDRCVCFVSERIKFHAPTGQKPQPTHGNVLVYFGENETGFLEAFASFGRCVLPRGSHSEAA